MEKAAFSISKYQFDKVSIDLSNYRSKDIKLDFQTSGMYFDENKEFELQFTVNAFNENENPFVQVNCVGTFSFENVSSFEEIPDFFYRNSIAILFPYLRAYVSIVTTQANGPGIILPTLNLSSLENTLRKNTSKK
ncbi:protein-export chaperone SecB [Marivirga sp.]|uniref:protein-export chaperone SecB n=1 Tax=Marivirga sp. TaxID=2018662 RepID=UPI0025E582B4|nr:protein-export chaperone SecB [Marivirga sp.]